MTPIATPTLTNISDRSQIYFAGSPIHIDITTSAPVDLDLYIWRGYQTADLPTTPQISYRGIPLVSAADTYVAFEISEQIRSYIVASNVNESNPQWNYNNVKAATLAGEGVYWQIVTRLSSGGGIVQYGTNFATLGFRGNYEQKGLPYSTYEDEGSARKWARNILYDDCDFRLTTVAATSHSGNKATVGMIAQTPIVPYNPDCQTGSPYLIAYLNKLGLWDTFTPFGKIVTNETISGNSYNRTYRDPLHINNSIKHSVMQGQKASKVSYTINTGALDESMIYQIQELIYSPKVYLVAFSGAVITSAQVGMTADTTTASADDTTITADTTAVTVSSLGFYSNFKQIPVICTNTSYIHKSKLNDKNKISYDLTFDETNSFINNVR